MESLPQLGEVSSPGPMIMTILLSLTTMIFGGPPKPAVNKTQPSTYETSHETSKGELDTILAT